MAQAPAQQTLHAQLRQSVFDCRERGLYEAASWSAQQLLGLPADCDHGAAPVAPGGTQESDTYLYAKSLFDLKEYQRCANTLENADATDAKATFLRLYALYLSGERRRHEEKIELSGSLGNTVVPNRNLEELEIELEDVAAAEHPDPFCLYLYGLVLSDRGKKANARRVLRDCVAAYPCNWCAWKALQGLCDDWDEVLELELPGHVTRDFFFSILCLELQCTSEALSRMHKLSEVFPRSIFLQVKAAVAHYSNRKMEEARDLFEDVLKRDGYILDDLHHYSNILYMREDFAKLSHLAHRAVLIDKYRPETCCIIGNYYSLKSETAKAILYFQRALKLSPYNLEAWILIGHEYLECKKPNAAIEAYRRAVDVNGKDYRAWYGLGFAYEFLNMPYYALFYFRKAAQLRPNDARMWVAMGGCYAHAHLQQYPAAAKCYRRAVTSGDHEHIVLHKLAETYKIMGHHDAAFSCYKQNLAQMDQQNYTGQDSVDALTFMSDYCLRNSRLADAETYAMRLQDFGGPAKDEARKILDEVEKQKQMGGSVGSGQAFVAAAVAAAPLDPWAFGGGGPPATPNGPGGK